LCGRWGKIKIPKNKLRLRGKKLGRGQGENKIP